MPGGALYKLPCRTKVCSLLAQKSPGEPGRTQTLCKETHLPVCSSSCPSETVLTEKSKPQHWITSVLQCRLPRRCVPSAQEVALSQILSLPCPSRWKYNLSFLYVCAHHKNSRATEYCCTVRNSTFNLDAFTGAQ